MTLYIDFKVTCLITCLVLYWPEFIEFLLISFYFGIGSVSSYFIWLKMSLLDVKIRKKVNSKYFFNSWCCILDYFILNCKLWDKFLNSTIILNFIISYILMFYKYFELIFEFMALKRAPICGRNVCLSFFFRIFTSNSDIFNQIK